MPVVDYKFEQSGARDVTAATRQVDASMGQMQSTGTKTTSTMTKLSEASILLGTNLIGMAKAAVDAGKKLFDMGRSGAVALDTLAQFEQFNTEGAVSSMEALRAATANVVDDTSLQRIGILSSQLGIASDDATEFFGAITAVAESRGQLGDLANVIERVQKDLQTGRTRTIEQLGLVADADTVFRKEAESLGIAVGQLTNQQKQQLLIQEAVAAHTRGDFGPSVEAASRSFLQMDTTIANLESSIEEFVAETLLSSGAVQGIEDAVTFASKAFADNKDQITELLFTLGDLAADLEKVRAFLFGPYGDAINRTIRQLSALAKSIQFTISTLKAFASLIKGAFLGSVATVTGAVATLTETLDVVVQAANSVGLVSDDMASDMAALADETRNTADALEADAAASMAFFHSETRQANEAAADAINLLFDLGEEAQTTADSVDNAAIALGTLVGNIAAMQAIRTGVETFEPPPLRPRKERVRKDATDAGIEWGASFWESAVASVKLNIEEIGVVGEEFFDTPPLAVEAGQAWGLTFWQAAFQQELITESLRNGIKSAGAEIQGLTTAVLTLPTGEDEFAAAAKSIGDGVSKGLRAGRQAIGIFVKDKQALAAVEGGFQIAEAAAAFAAAITNPIMALAGIGHVAAAVEYFRVAGGKGGGGRGRATASGGGGSRGAQRTQRRERAEPRQTQARAQAPTTNLFVDNVFVGNPQSLGQSALTGLNAVARSDQNDRIDTRILGTSPSISGF
jgi:hypothetical protein